MLILIRLLTLIAPFVVASPFWFVFESLTLMLVLQIISVILIFVCYWLFSKINKTNLNWRSLLLVEFFLVNLYALSLLMERRIFLVTLSILTLLVTWAWLELTFKKTVAVNDNNEINPDKTIFFLIYASFFATLFGLREFLVWPVWVLFLIVLVYVFLVFNNWLVVQADLIDRWQQRFVVAFTQAQLFLILLVLPLPYYSKGALMTAIYFYLDSLFDAYQKQRLVFKNIFIKTSIFLTFLMLILLTTKW